MMKTLSGTSGQHEASEYWKLMEEVERKIERLEGAFKQSGSAQERHQEQAMASQGTDADDNSGAASEEKMEQHAAEGWC